MKSVFFVLLVLLVGSLSSGCNSGGGEKTAVISQAQLLRDDVLVVVNDNSIASPQVGDYYREKRGINPANIAHVRVPATNDVELDQFISLRDQLIRHMQLNTLPPGVMPVSCDISQGYTRYYCPQSVDQLRQLSRIRYIVTTKGIPIRFNFTGSTLTGNSEASIDNYLRFWLINYFSEDVRFSNNQRAYDFGDGRGMRPVDPKIDGELVVGRIDGVNAASAQRLIDRAISAEQNGIYGKLYGNKFGAPAAYTGPEGASWKSFLPGGLWEIIYPSWRYLHGLFGELNTNTGLAVRHVTNPDCLTYDPSGMVPKECVVAVNRGNALDQFTVNDHAPGTPGSRILYPDNALVYQGHLDRASTLFEFDHVLNWREDDTCNALCRADDAVCKAASTDVYQELDTRCVRVAEGFMGYQFQSYPVGMMQAWPTGWFTSNNRASKIYSLRNGSPYYYWEPEVRDDDGFDDNYSLWYRDADNIPAPACFDGTEDYLLAPTLSCAQEKRININQEIDIPERAINTTSPQTITLRFKYRALDLNKNVALVARPFLREPAYDDGIIAIGNGNNRVVYPSVDIKTFTAPNDPVDGISWGDAVVSFTVDPALHQHPQLLFNGIQIMIEGVNRFEGQFAIDTVTLDMDGIDIPMINPSFNDGHRQLSSGDTAVTFLNRLNGLAFWGNITHHGDDGHSFGTHPYETLIYFMRGLPLGEAVWFAEMRNGGIFYGDPLYSPIAVHLHYMASTDSRAPADTFHNLNDSPLLLTGDTLNGAGTNVSTTYSVDYCSGSDFLPCDQTGSWQPIPGLQGLPGGQRSMLLGGWDISAMLEGDYVLRLAVTSSNSASGLSQTFYDYYPVTLVSPSSDSDADGLDMQTELLAGTNPWDSDTDGDGMPDGWEMQYQLDPLTGNANADSDSDGHTDLVEYLRAVDPSDNQSLPAVTTHDVDTVNGMDDGQSPFKTIYAAYNNAQAGDTIRLLAGDHNGPVLYFSIPVNLTGAPGHGAVLRTIFLKNLTPAEISISDLSIIVDSVLVIEGSLRFERNTISGNTTLVNDSSTVFINNLITGASQDALNVIGHAAVVLENNTLTANSVGIRASATANLVITNSIISGNSVADLVGVSPSAVSYSLTGDASLAGSNGNLTGDPIYIDPLNGNFRLRSTSPAVDAGDPQSDFSLEPISAVGRINMGRYGNTAQAATAP